MNKTLRSVLKQIGLIAVIITIGTGIDWLAHQISPEFSVPPEYFRNKIIFGTLIAFIAFRLIRTHVKNPYYRSAIVMSIVAVLLQTKYLLQGYELFFVFLFIPIHFIAFFLPGCLIFKRFDRLFSA